MITSTILFSLRTVDRFIAYAPIPVVLGACVGLHLVYSPPNATFLLAQCVHFLGVYERIGGIVVLLTVVEMIARYCLGQGKADTQRIDGAVFRSRVGILVLSAAMAGGAYGALVNAMGFYSLSKLFDRRLADMSSFESFETIFLDNIRVQSGKP